MEEEQNLVPRSESDELLRTLGHEITEENHEKFAKVAQKKHKKANNLLNFKQKKFFFWTKTTPRTQETLQEVQVSLSEAAQLYLALYHVTALNEYLTTAKKIIKKEIGKTEANLLKEYPESYETSEAYNTTWKLLREAQAKKRGDAPNF